MRSDQVYKVAWPWDIMKVQKGCRKINIKLGWNSDVEKIPVKSYNMVHAISEQLLHSQVIWHRIILKL